MLVGLATVRSCTGNTGHTTLADSARSSSGGATAAVQARTTGRAPTGAGTGMGHAADHTTVLAGDATSPRCATPG